MVISYTIERRNGLGTWRRLPRKRLLSKDLQPHFVLMYHLAQTSVWALLQSTRRKEWKRFTISLDYNVDTATKSLNWLGVGQALNLYKTCDANAGQTDGKLKQKMKIKSRSKYQTPKFEENATKGKYTNSFII